MSGPGRHWRPRKPARVGPGAAAFTRTAAAAVAGLTVALLLGGVTGVALGLAAAAGVWAWLVRQPTRAQRAEQRRIAIDLPYAADLLAAVLRAGAPPDAAARTVGGAIGGPLGDRLTRVGRALQLGAPPDEAWAHLAAGDAAPRFVRAAVHSHASGAALAATLTRLGEELRADRQLAAEAAARRAGVLIVLPLGLCFLPAFVLAGLVPAIVAVLGDVLPR